MPPDDHGLALQVAAMPATWGAILAVLSLAAAQGEALGVHYRERHAARNRRRGARCEEDFST